MRILTTTQGDDLWDIARKGRITASGIGNVLAGKGTKSRFEYRMQLCLDLEGVEDFRDSAIWFEDGRRYEGHARGWYDWNIATVTETGFVLHDEYNWLGASPDGLVGEDGWRLSHGERSRVYIARAILQNADLIILDESFASLDPENLETALRCVLKRSPTLLVIAHP